jgi:ferritin-like protein
VLRPITRDRRNWKELVDKLCSSWNDEHYYYYYYYYYYCSNTKFIY